MKNTGPASAPRAANVTGETFFKWQLILNAAFLSAQQHQKTNSLCAVCHSAFLARGPVFHRERMRANFSQR